MFDGLKLDPSDPTPLYLQLQAELRSLIEAGKLLPGDAVPGERDLANRLKISRVTIRRAISNLAADGLLVQRQGAGTFVARRMEASLSVLSSFSDDMRARGMTPESRWIERVVAVAMPEEALSLSLSPGASVVRLTRVRLADGMPLAVERASVPSAYLPDLTQLGSSLYAAMAIAGARPVRALQRIRAEKAGERDADMLAIPVGAPVLAIERRGFDALNRPVELTRSRIRADLYDFIAELRGL
ncbi:GntR family transcriptional regulator [Lacibacterium aquatile]|uniref:GntR family transcriptional regulator n=1 Tax=Lacibacterium aquatile TaxID=1168082 RepID=A0ABW5DQA1_9PROT